LDYLMDDAVRSGDSAKLEKSVACTHRLKSAVPAGCLARMGALVGGGTQRQIDSVGMYMESIGLAFQIIDDVLNLKGFEGNVKDRGEDIKAGKVTFPVAKAMSSSRLDLTARTQVWETLKSKPQDNAVVGALIKRLDECGAIDASVDEANSLVAKAWADVDQAIPDSFYKMLLRAFGWYVLERHY
jgi:geranylgeranyl pyrophosphate synthase